MIFYGTVGHIAQDPTAEVLAHQAAIAGIYCEVAVGSGTAPFELHSADPTFELYVPQPQTEMVIEEFDWSNKRTNRDYR
jgi:hypothetical protein